MALPSAFCLRAGAVPQEQARVDFRFLRFDLPATN